MTIQARRFDSGPTKLDRMDVYMDTLVKGDRVQVYYPQHGNTELATVPSTGTVHESGQSAKGKWFKVVKIDDAGMKTHRSYSFGKVVGVEVDESAQSVRQREAIVEYVLEMMKD